MATILASITTEHYRTEIKAGVHTIISDEPADMGGTALGPTPDELLAASLGACTCATLRMYADRKGWALEAVTASVTFNRGDGKSFISRNIVLTGKLDDTERARLLEIANRCPVHRTLSHTIEISTTLEPEQ